MGMALL